MTVGPFSRSISADALRFVLDNCERYEVVERTDKHVILAIWVASWGNNPHRVTVPVWKWERVQG